MQYSEEPLADVPAFGRRFAGTLARVTEGPRERLLDFLAEHGVAVLFSAALSVVLEHLGALAFLNKLSVLLVAALAAQDGSPTISFSPGAPAVVLLTEADFVTRYGERAPLDRCILAGDIEKLLAKSPRLLAVDFDLSPLARPTETERACQSRLDGLLDRHAPRLVLLAPFPTRADALLNAKHEWMRDRCRAGVSFADGTLDTSMGMVIEYADGEHGAMRTRLAEQLHEGADDAICREVAGASGPHANPWLQEERHPAGEAREPERLPINFSAAMRRLAVFPFESESFNRLATLEGRPVVFGGDWGRDDSFLTPIGPLAGATIHGAKLVSLEKPITVSGWRGLACDIAIGLCFAWLVQGFWTCYSRARQRDIEIEQTGRPPAMGLGTGWMLLFILTCGALVLLLTFAAQYMFSQEAVSMSPLVIALSMMVDGFVLGPIEQLSRAAEGEHRQSGDVPEKRIVSAALAIIATAILLLVVPSAGLNGAAGPLEPSAIAGRTFMFGVGAFYLASVLVAFRASTLKQCWHCFLGQFMKTAHIAAAVARGTGQGWRWNTRLGALIALLRILAYWAVIVSALRFLLHV
jgi:hypothetical protein